MAHMSMWVGRCSGLECPSDRSTVPGGAAVLSGRGEMCGPSGRWRSDEESPHSLEKQWTVSRVRAPKESISGLDSVSATLTSCHTLISLPNPLKLSFLIYNVEPMILSISLGYWGIAD